MTNTRVTSSTNAILDLIRSTLLEWTNPLTQQRAVDVLGKRFYLDRAPDNLTFPYGVMRMSTRNDGKFYGMRLIGSVEIMVYGRPYTQKPLLNDVCDCFDQAMLTLIESSNGGLTFAFGSQRDPLPVAGDPVDSETPTIRLVYTLAIWPTYLTTLTKTLPE